MRMEDNPFLVDETSLIYLLKQDVFKMTSL